LLKDLSETLEKYKDNNSIKELCLRILGHTLREKIISIEDFMQHVNFI